MSSSGFAGANTKPIQSVALFGAGKIGRALVARIFAQNGYEVVFIDVDDEVVAAINSRGRYPVTILHADGSHERHWVERVRGIHGRDMAACAAILARVSLAITAVGASVVPAVCRTVAAILQDAERAPPLDMLFAENMHNAVAVARQEFQSCGISPDRQPGLIAASIGTTAVDAPQAAGAPDLLSVCVDSYDTLVVSARGWRSPPPQFAQLHVTQSIAAYVERKLFIHNLAHCALAYFGHQALPAARYICEIVDHAQTRERVQALVNITARALVREYPDEFTTATMTTYVTDVWGRIANPALRDSIWRVGRDVPRKLGRSDRVVGSLLLVARHRLAIDGHLQLYAAALSFRARNEQGALASEDEQFFRALDEQGPDYALFTVSQFDATNALEQEATHGIRTLITANSLA